MKKQRRSIVSSRSHYAVLQEACMVKLHRIAARLLKRKVL